MVALIAPGLGDEVVTDPVDVVLGAGVFPVARPMPAGTDAPMDVKPLTVRLRVGR